MSDIQRWYMGFRTVGKADVVIQRIGSAVATLDLGKYIPVVRIERRPKREFYFFVGIESSKPGMIPPAAEDFFKFDFLSQPQGVFSLEDIQRFVGVDHSVQDYARRIPYTPPRVYTYSDPFEADSQLMDVANNDDAVILRSTQYARLLGWISALGSGTWGMFQAACQQIFSETGDSWPPAQATMRKLRLLGHIEATKGGARWETSPTALIVARSSHAGQYDRSYVLCGARDSAIVSALYQAASVESIPQVDGSGPPIVVVHAQHDLLFDGPLSGIEDEGDAARRLVEILPPMARWTDLLTPLPGLSPYRFECRRFDGRGFVEEPFNRRAGFYELWPTDVAQKSTALVPTYTVFYEPVNDRWLRGDWYGLRFLAHISEGQSCPINFDPPTGRLAIPGEWRWPELYERALVLSSGRLPSASSDHAWLIYEGISADLLSELKLKLPLTVSDS